ncbi:MAG TPA: cell surface protein [Bacteroidetes bacterium]|nr:cell surface protein [Bacteroidota bacterium]
MKKIIFLSLAIAAIAAAYFFFQPGAPIVNPADYKAFTTDAHFKKAKKTLADETLFWEQKLAGSPGNFVFQKKLAGCYARRFKLTGDAHYLHRSDSLLKWVNHRIPGQAGTLQALAANAITRHAFREAEKYIKEAYETGENQFVSSLILVDVLLERGQFFSAKQFLQTLASDSQFDYLIRDVKFQDASGNLEKAIEQMEKASAKAEASGNDKATNWSLSNLADMYGHNGSVEKSYSTYLEALSYDPADLHSLKGIAWIAFSHDKNTAEAKRILHFLKSIHPVPDYDLLLSEIAVFEKDEKTVEALRQKFIAEAGRPMYGNMYKSYLCRLLSNTAGALAIAKDEVAERPHPMSYDLLAWASLQNGDLKKALETTLNHVLYQTQEPVAMYHAGLILKAAGRYDEAGKYLEEALDAAFELGPVVELEIKEELDGMEQGKLAFLRDSSVKCVF